MPLLVDDILARLQAEPTDPATLSQVAENHAKFYASIYNYEPNSHERARQIDEFNMKCENDKIRHNINNSPDKQRDKQVLEEYLHVEVPRETPGQKIYSYFFGPLGKREREAYRLDLLHTTIRKVLRNF